MAEQSEEPIRPATPIVDNETIEISANSDLVISVFSSKTTRGDRRVTKFKVETRALTTNSRYFSASLSFNKTNGHPDVELKDDDINAIHIWLVYMQAAKDKEDAGDSEGENQAKKRRLDGEDRTAEEALFEHNVVKSTDIERIWHMINAADKYLLDASILRDFFDLWYKKNIHVNSLNKDLARQVALPCYMFDHAMGFAEVTKWLAYNHVGHITEKRPQGFKWQHVHLAPPNFVGPMNHARGSLRTSIHRGIWSEIGYLLSNGPDTCECESWASTAGHYFAGLVNTSAYPLEKTFSRSSVAEILSRLSSFTIEECGSCDLCSTDWEAKVAHARIKTLEYFDGLCIDCMDRSRPKRENSDVDYWRQLESIDGRWDKNCRVKHDEPSWYISWCGRAEHRQKLIERHRDQNRG